MALTTCLLTGSSGFLGRHLAEHLTADGIRVVALSRRDAVGDLADLVRVKRIEHWIHAAGRINGSARELAAGNEQFARRVIEALGPAVPSLHAVYVSSVSAIDAGTPYGRAKRCTEDIFKAAAFKRLVILRPSLLYGSHDTRNVGTLVRWIRTLPVVPVLGGRDGRVQPLFVGDLYSVIRSYVLDVSRPGATLTVAGPRQESLWAMADAIRTHLGRRVVLVPIPVGPFAAAARALQPLVPFLNLPVQQLEGLTTQPMWQSSEEAIRMPAFRPRLFADGVKELL